MRGKVIASGTQIIFKEFENVEILCVSVSYVSELISGINKFSPFAWKCVETRLHGIA